MSKLNWDRASTEGRTQRHGLEIDYSAGEQFYPHNEKTTTKDIYVIPTFVPKIIVRSKERQKALYIATLNELIELVKHEIISIGKDLKRESIRKFNDASQKLIHLCNDDETRKLIGDARLAVRCICNKPDMNQTIVKIINDNLAIINKKKKKRIKLKKPKNKTR